jgi:7-cyano-7-deazaguanine synthase in queuosine biosynthesis
MQISGINYGIKRMKVLILHSGGLDSTLCLVMAMEKKHQIISLGIDYGQRHRIELEYAAAQCRKYDIERHIIRVEWDNDRGRSCRKCLAVNKTY